MNDSFNYVPNTQDAQGGRTIYFDIDSVCSAPKRLDNNDTGVLSPIPKYVDMIKEFKRMGYRIGIITNTEDKARFERQGLTPFIDSFQAIPQGVSKYEAVKDKTGVLVSDDDKVLNTWFSDRIKIIK